jgi:gluconolactonase
LISSQAYICTFSLDVDRLVTVCAMLASVGSAALPRFANAAKPFTQRYLGTRMHVLDESFLALRIFNVRVEKLAAGMR